ncbi:hypothetical protein PsYK624_161830 [Phanerochaete sordida]|uniref:Uncharacterized protein n=1 Tax=Phanerochaete sordida TaxID=48140 RepID=A0A9P3GRT8_9APHY|nr:hypothetical protein PsYK624_161830 [Phanerochaete sordida]
MNPFWSLLDWFFPAIRLTDDLRLDDPEALLAGRAYALHTRTLSNPSGRQTPRLPAPDTVEWHRQRERRKDGERTDRDREREREGRESELVGMLRRENEELRTRVQQLERDLQLSRQSVAYAQDVGTPALPLHVGLPPPPRIPHGADAGTLRTAYDALAASHAAVQQALRERVEEVASLRTFLTKTDDLSGAQLVQAVRDLNSEILQLAASAADEFAGTFDRRVRYARASDRETLYPALGVRTTELLEEQDHAQDPTFVQFAIQAWEVACVGRLMVPFCAGAPGDVQRLLSAVYQRMQQTEPQATASRWRALTHANMRAVLPTFQGANMPPPTPVTPTTPATPGTGAASFLAAYAEDNLRGILAILVLAGCSDYNGLHREPLRKRFGGALARIGERAHALATSMREGVMSAAFEVVLVPPSMASAGGAPPASKRGALFVDTTGGALFEPGAMDDAFAAEHDPGEEHARVLCTVEIGLACVRKIEGVEENGGSLSPASPAPQIARAPSNDLNVLSRVSSTSSSADASKLLDRNLLVKPKVMLDSVTALLEL